MSNFTEYLRDLANDNDEEGEIAAALTKAADEINRLNSFFASTLPFLREAWEACFDGKKEKLLSCEERGMGRLLAQFQEIAYGKPAVPFGLVTVNEANARVNRAVEWAHRTLGEPNKLREPLRRWVGIGRTCADGLDRCNEEVERLKELLGRTADGHPYGIGSKVYYRDPTGYIQGLDVGPSFRTDSSVPEQVYCPHPVYSSREAAEKAKGTSTS